jgi:hypothetical protein
MTAYTINITLQDGLVVATLSPIPGLDPSPNPLEVNRGDTVQWKLDPDLSVELLAFLQESDMSLSPSQGKSPFLDPFQSTQPNKVAATAKGGLYLYTVSDKDGMVLPWQVSLFSVGSYRGNLGGIPVPPDPPR